MSLFSRLLRRRGAAGEPEGVPLPTRLFRVPCGLGEASTASLEALNDVLRVAKEVPGVAALSFAGSTDMTDVQLGVQADLGDDGAPSAAFADGGDAVVLAFGTAGTIQVAVLLEVKLERIGWQTEDGSPVREQSVLSAKRFINFARLP